MSDISPDSVRAVISDFPDPQTGRPIGTMGQIQSIEVDGVQVSIAVAIPSSSLPIVEDVVSQLTDLITTSHHGAKVSVQVLTLNRPPTTLGNTTLKVRNVILVGSGKGGVGKSTVAASLALSLRKFGAHVGLMDADVYGPSIPHLLGLEGRPAIDEDKKIQPNLLEGGTIDGTPASTPLYPLPVMSMGFILEPDQAVIWRGPMLDGSIKQFLGQTDWGPLDYLIIDMPPGTGDIALTLSQAVPVTGAVVVCTPQEVALLDAVKAVAMFKKVNIPVLGMVENMNGFLCPDNGKTYDIFGRGGARKKAEELDVPFLGGLPINMDLRIAGDEGQLGAVISDDAAARAPIDQIARALVRSLSKRSAAAPKTASLPVL